jgi:F-type H+-transporting ATPase subunit delta
MSESRAALRYAKAVMELSLEKQKVQVIEGDMRSVLAVLEENKSLVDVLTSPVLKTTDKLSVLKEIFSSADSLTIELFGLLGENKRVGLLAEVANQFVGLYEKMQGQDVAQVTTAVPLTPELEVKILNQLKQITGKEVTLVNQVEPSLIGGFILRVGDLEYNASVSGTLANLKRDLIHI